MGGGGVAGSGGGGSVAIGRKSNQCLRRLLTLGVLTNVSNKLLVFFPNAAKTEVCPPGAQSQTFYYLFFTHIYILYIPQN